MRNWVQLPWGDYLDVSRITAIKVIYRGDKYIRLECLRYGEIMYDACGEDEKAIVKARDLIFNKIQNPEKHDPYRE